MAEIAISLSTKLYMFNRTREWRGNSCAFRELEKTISSCIILLLDAEAMWDQLPNPQRDLIRKLKDVVYDADDLFDEFRTPANTHQNTRKLYKKFSREVKDIHMRFDAINVDYNFSDLNVNVNDEPIGMRKHETSSCVNASDVIIGRDEDKESVINMLLHGDNNSDVGFLSVVGVGGLGKTALARLVFNDERIIHEYPDPSFRIWVSVSDLDWKERFALKTILCKSIVSTSTDHKCNDDTSTMELVEDQFLEKLKGKKYFLVLDDVWNEDHEKWLDLKRYLLLGCEGSRVLVTTRSMKTATITGDGHGHVYMLQSLPKEHAWHLFQMLAFVPELDEVTHLELVKIGKNIVDKCYCNPLVIKVVGSLLFGQPISKWQTIEWGGWAKTGEGDNTILPTLKLSYHNLEPLTQSCFRYCAIFPRDYRIQKETIIGLWMAQGYVVVSNRDESIEDVAEEQVSNLLDMCFFEDAVRDEYGDVESFKIHNLMYDVAQDVGEEEIHIVGSFVNYLGDNIRHVHLVSDRCPDISLYKIRSYVGGSEPFIDKKIDNWMRLRVLDLSGSEINNLPDSMGKLLHLRYLNLSRCKNIELLCDSITQLHNLQTLNLDKCDKLTCMPSGMKRLTNLRILPLFVVGNSISSEKQSREGMLKDLNTLFNIKGKICIKIGTNYRTVEEGIETPGEYLKTKEYLKEIRFEFVDGATCAYNPEALMDELEPPSNIKGIFLHNYKGTRIKSWGRACHNWTICFPLLVHIVIWKCGNLQQMPVLSKLPLLKILSLSCLDSLEYMENIMSSTRSDEELAEFFPSLQILKIMWMERLKGWWKRDDAVEDWPLKLTFPNLSNLKIYKCPNLVSFAHCQISDNVADHEFPRLCSLKIANCPNLAFNLICPAVETLELRDVGERLQITVGNTQDEGKWRHMEVDRVIHLKPINTNFLSRLCVHGDSMLESLSEVDVFQSCVASLRELEIRYCANLRQLSGLEHLTALEALKLLSNDNLSISEDDEEPWKFFHRTLLQLKFDALPGMTSLPKGMQCFTSLQILELRWCENLEELPQWMSCLSSLKSLSIIRCPRIRFLPEAMKELTSLKNLSIQHGCPVLFTRCQNPDGEDYHKIQHISNLSIR